jgi:DNA-binding NtrC family response regulator
MELSRQLFHRTDGGDHTGAVVLVESGLEMYGGNLKRAVLAARVGVEYANRTSQVIPFAGSLTNLGSLMLFTGELQKAAEHLQRALDVSGQLPFIRLSALDSLAQVSIAAGDQDKGLDLLRACSNVIQGQRLPARSWYDLAHQLTRCSYYERTENWRTILDIADEADPELARRQFKALRTSLLCARARALAHLGRHERANAALGAAIRACPRGAVDPLIVLEASKGACASLRGDQTAGTVHFDRALAAARAIGHRNHEAWIERQRRTLSTGPTSRPATPRRLDVTDAALLLHDVATVLGAGHSIDLLAHRMAAILRATTLDSRVDVESESGCDYLAEPTASWEADPDGTFHIHLRGSDRRVRIRVRGVQSIDEISLMKSVADLVQAAVNRTADTENEDEDLNLWPRTTVQDGDDTVFQSPRMLELVRVAVRLAAADLPILITGETGTGKEIIARLIHEHSRVRRGPFVPFNCSAMPRDLVESQLFGHRRGAFTGAMDSSPGVVRTAEHGTLFLDEIADLDPATQPKLLRFLENGEIHPVGELRPLKVSVRFVAATNADLDDLAEQGHFRKDLFYRIGVAKIALPPLRERKDEIPALASLFLARYARECERSGLRLSDDFVAALLLCDWPGNIRQLANEIRRVVAMASDGQVLDSTVLDPEIARKWQARAAEITPSPRSVSVSLDQTLEAATADLERRFIEYAMGAAGGKVADAAQLLGLSRKGLFLKRRRRGLLSEQG